MSVTAEFGSISSGTLRTEDLLDALADELRRLATRAGNEDHIALCYEADTAYEVLNDDCRNRDADECAKITEEAPEIVDELINALDEYAPPFGYFGANEGDGANFGFWFSHDAFEDACRCGEVVKIEAGDDVAQALRDNPEAEYVASVTDHGNVTLYRRKIEAEKVWSLV